MLRINQKFSLKILREIKSAKSNIMELNAQRRDIIEKDNKNENYNTMNQKKQKPFNPEKAQT